MIKPSDMFVYPNTYSNPLQELRVAIGHAAADAKLDEFGHVDPPASRLAPGDPPLALPNPVGKLALG
ncbi:MAG: hypothetical protein ABSD28_14555 [Tepidisphaeraceae bacterium]|jgi:hypothetical protein